MEVVTGFGIFPIWGLSITLTLVGRIIHALGSLAASVHLGALSLGWESHKGVKRVCLEFIIADTGHHNLPTACTFISHSSILC